MTGSSCLFPVKALKILVSAGATDIFDQGCGHKILVNSHFYQIHRRLLEAARPFLLDFSKARGNPRPPDSTPDCPQFVPAPASGF